MTVSPVDRGNRSPYTFRPRKYPIAPESSSAMSSKPASASQARTSAGAGAGAEEAGEAADLADRQVAEAGVGEQGAAGQDAAGVQHAGHLQDGEVRVGEAVQAGEGDDQVELAVGEGQRADVGEHRLDLRGHVALAGDRAWCGRACACEMSAAT